MSKESVEAKLKFIRNYIAASNAATGSEVDSNANVTSKNVATMCAEIPKRDMIELNRAIVKEYLAKMGEEELIPMFEEDLKKHRIYSHDETSIYPYCVAVSLYPYLLDGLKPLGGTSGAPKHAEAFIGGLVNLVFLIAGQFAGAVAVPETLPYLDHFLRVDYGEDYTEHLDDVIESFGNRKGTLRNRIENLFQQFVYCINQPAGARGYQSPFTNIAYFDKGYFEAIFKDFIFPDGDEPNYESTKALQKMFMEWFNQERTKAVLTFPVETANLLYDENKQFVDSDMADWCSYMWSKGHSFFVYNSGSADALSSCCFEGSELITVKHKDTGTYETMSIKDFCVLHDQDYSNYSIVSYNVGKDIFEYADITGTLIKNNEHPNMIRIEAKNGSILTVTPEHVFLVRDAATNLLVEKTVKELLRSPEEYDLIQSVNATPVAFTAQVVEDCGKVYDIELSKNHFFFANNILTHNCRLKNGIENNVFSYTLGAGGLRTGSKKVITLNLNRITQDWDRAGRQQPLEDYIGNIVKRVHKYLLAWNGWLKELYEAGVLTVYSAGYIALEDQYLTVGLNGLLEAAEYLKIEPKANNEEYATFVDNILSKIKQINIEDRTEEVKYNSELVPKFFPWAR